MCGERDLCTELTHLALSLPPVPGEICLSDRLRQLTPDVFLNLQKEKILMRG